MTVAELIEKLKEQDPEMEVVYWIGSRTSYWDYVEKVYVNDFSVFGGRRERVVLE